MVKKIVLKVDLSCGKCKKKVIKAISGIEGIDKIEVDTAKSTLTVMGNADPIDVIVRTRKAGRSAEVISIGPPPPPPPKPDAQKKEEEKKPMPEKKAEEKKPEKKPDPPPPVFVHIPSCSVCQRMVVVDDYNPPCSIM
ncbi:heavy metal-associated isoprenylated plant protein 2-like [Typha latifolia]|uniref:heavy metal-associated isoprenylated plant protein 2-like n=1 Tax=Typha latifolia TaxID=4733 RepID=UPI003C2B2D94